MDSKGEIKGGKMFEDPRLDLNKIRFPMRDNYEKRLILSATVNPDIKRTIFADRPDD